MQHSYTELVTVKGMRNTGRVMRFSCLASGSKANCTFVASIKTSILIDVGLSARQVEQRLARVDSRPQDISAILVTHEHSDHISGVASFSRKHRIPVYANRGAQKDLKGCYHIETFDSGADFEVDGISVQPVPVQHDAEEPVGFVLSCEGIRLAVITDLGRITPQIRGAVKQLNGIVLESNHDQQLLQTCGYPWHLKQRIASTHGHLSNDSAAAFLADIADSELSHVVLGHLSENSNTPKHAMNTARGHLSNWGGAICCASVGNPTPIADLNCVAGAHFINQELCA